jgi:deoxyribodipyrimidine photo-lyase
MGESTIAGPAVIVWFRQDLRLDDNPALLAACDSGRPVVSLFIWSPEEEGRCAPGAASRWWLHHSVRSLDEGLRRRGSELIVRIGPALEVLCAVVRETGAKSVLWNRRYEPEPVERDRQVESELRDGGLEARSFNSALLFEPWAVATKAGDPYRVFTPYWRACLGLDEPAAPCSAPKRLAAPKMWPESLELERLQLLPTIDWASGMRTAWTPGEAGANERLRTLLSTVLTGYTEGRDRPALLGTSRLSPHLHWGEISPRRIWHAVRDAAAQAALERRPAAAKAGEGFLRELGWREFAYHLLYHFPRTAESPLRPDFGRFPWRDDQERLRAWQQGRTGYPLVDAGMRELWSTGWMHNRVRMVAASFLLKDLLISWQSGAAWFWDTLVDADLANNTLGWQWSAGCGADAAPYFRIFNPVRQGMKFDPAGEYVRRWIPELAKLPDRWVHEPWSAPDDVLRQAGVKLGENYPHPIVDHGEARTEALAAFESIRGA